MKTSRLFVSFVIMMTMTVMMPSASAAGRVPDDAPVPGRPHPGVPHPGHADPLGGGLDRVVGDGLGPIESVISWFASQLPGFGMPLVGTDVGEGVIVTRSGSFLPGRGLGGRPGRPHPGPCGPGPVGPVPSLLDR